jgi:hypothetical protein
MPSREKSIPIVAPPSPTVGVSPTRMDPEHFESYLYFRETFLLLVTDGTANKAFRILGMLLHQMIMEYGGRYWPGHREGETRAEVRAARRRSALHPRLLDPGWRWVHQLQALAQRDEYLGRRRGPRPAGRAIADELEGALRRWRGETH